MFHRGGDRDSVDRSRGLFGLQVWVALIDNLLQQRSNIEVNARCRDLPPRRVILVNSTTGQLNVSVGCRMAREGTCVFCFKSKLDDRNVSLKNYVLHEVAISGKRGDKGPNELLANSRLPLHETARNLDRHILRVVRHDAVLIGPAPRGVVLDHERFDIVEGSECSNGRHGELVYKGT